MNWLKQFAQDPNRGFNWFLTGAGLFFAGLAILMIAETQLYESVVRDLIALLSLGMIISGLAVAVIGYLGMNYYRWTDFFTRTPSGRTEKNSKNSGQSSIDNKEDH